MTSGISGLEGLNKLAAAYKEGGRKVRTRMAAGLREAADPLAKYVVKEGSAKMPKSGGLADRLAASDGKITVSLLGKNAAVSIRVSNGPKDRIRKIDKTGQVKHPVWGNRSAWTFTKTAAHAYTDAFIQGAPPVRQAVQLAVQEALNEIAVEASS